MIQLTQGNLSGVVSPCLRLAMGIRPWSDSSWGSFQSMMWWLLTRPDLFRLLKAQRFPQIGFDL